MRWPSMVYGVIFEISSNFSAASSNLAPSELNKSIIILNLVILYFFHVLIKEYKNRLLLININNSNLIKLG